MVTAKQIDIWIVVVLCCVFLLYAFCIPRIIILLIATVCVLIEGYSGLKWNMYILCTVRHYLIQFSPNTHIVHPTVLRTRTKVLSLPYEVKAVCCWKCLSWLKAVTEVSWDDVPKLSVPHTHIPIIVWTCQSPLPSCSCLHWNAKPQNWALVTNLCNLAFLLYIRSLAKGVKESARDRQKKQNVEWWDQLTKWNLP